MASQNYAGHLSSFLVSGMTSLVIGVGKELGLIQVLLDADQPVSVEDIAGRLNLKKRYTQEWLSCMISASIIQFDKDTQRYFVPEDNKVILDEVSSLIPIVLESGQSASAIENCFKETGPYGVTYNEHASFFDYWGSFRSKTGPSFVKNDLLPLLQKQKLYQKLDSGIRVLDLGCGSGTFTLILAELFPESEFVGVDYSEKAIGKARDNAKTTAVANVKFEIGNAQELNDKLSESFDLVFMYDVLHDMPAPDKALDEIKKVMKDDGTFLLIEVGYHSNPADNIGDRNASLIYAISLFLCLPSSMASEPHKGYGACWGKEAVEDMLKEKKFKIDYKHHFYNMNKDVLFFCKK